MDPVFLIILGVLVLVAVGAALYALNRSWGNFPADARYQPGSQPAAQPGPDRTSASVAGSVWESQPEGERSIPPEDLPAPNSWLVPINHPMVRRAAQQALLKGGPNARYIVRQGEQLMFDFSQISDPTQRREAYEAMRRFSAGEDVDFGAMMQVVRQLFNS